MPFAWTNNLNHRSLFRESRCDDGNRRSSHRSVSRLSCHRPRRREAAISHRRPVSGSAPHRDAEPSFLRQVCLPYRSYTFIPVLFEFFLFRSVKCPL
jgi:hypothetical protein